VLTWLCVEPRSYVCLSTCLLVYSSTLLCLLLLSQELLALLKRQVGEAVDTNMLRHHIAVFSSWCRTNERALSADAG